LGINGYNGGLFKKDIVLDELKVPDALLARFKGFLDYDFGSDLNVNILGQIFERSISALEQAKASGNENGNGRNGNGAASSRRANKQKNEGIYYTRDYVTQYIVRQTIGAWLADRRSEIGFDALPELDVADYASVKQKKSGAFCGNGNIEAHRKAWEAYKEALTMMKVLDPACGSGAFLNEAFQYLKSVGEAIDNELSRLCNGNRPVSHWGSEVLANNLFGVDLNEESVEITKLSLWLGSASKNEKLVNLDNNVKAGNSLISDESIAKNLAFSWRQKFPSILEKGGFDVVLGNPPYGAKLSQAEKDYISANYQTTEYNFDTYKTFMELGLKLTRQGGYMGYITPNTYFVLEKGATKLRKFLFENHTVRNIVELFNVFPKAIVEPVISIFKKTPPVDAGPLEVISVPRKTDLTSTFIADGIRTAFVQSDLREKEGYAFNFRATIEEKRIANKISEIARPLSDYFSVSAGVKPYEEGQGTPPQTREIMDSKPYEGHKKIDKNWMPLIRGENIKKYIDAWSGEYIKYGKWLAAPRRPEMFSNEKLFIRRTSDYPVATYDSCGKIGNNSIHCIYPKDNFAPSLKYLLGIINSKFMKWFFRYENFHMVGKPDAEHKVAFVERFPIVVSIDQAAIISLVDGLLNNCQSKFNATKEFVGFLVQRYNLKSANEKLNEFYNLDFAGFANELGKLGAKLTAEQERALMPEFDREKSKIGSLSETINDLEERLDGEIYALYGLSQDEISIIESKCS
jgi:hypothetical protein